MKTSDGDRVPAELANGDQQPAAVEPAPVEIELERAMSRRAALQRAGAAAAMLALPGLAVGRGHAAALAAGPLQEAVANRAQNLVDIPLLRWAMSAPSQLDIAKDNSDTAQDIMALGLEGLLTYTHELGLAPLLAKSWSQPNPRTYVYNLRTNVRFWDGTPLTAADVAYSLSRHLDPSVASVIGSFYANVKSIRVSGRHQVTVTMKQPDPLFQYVPVFSFITPKTFSKRLGKNLGVAGSTVNTMGTGPYRITAFDPSNGATLVRNPRYWGARSNLSKVQIDFISNPQNIVLAMQAGSIDGTFVTHSEDLSSYAGIQNVHTVVAAPMRLTYISFDMTQPPWDDLHVRRAVAHAADLAGYVKAFLGSVGEPAKAMVPPAQWGGLAPRSEVSKIYARIRQYPYDLNLAKQELAQSSHPQGFTASIEYSSSHTTQGKLLVALAQALQQIGITLNVQAVSSGQWISDVLAHTQPLAIIGFGPDYVDPADYLIQILPSAAAVKNQFNTANFKNAQVDQLLAKQARTTNKTVRAQLLAELLQITADQLPYLPLFYQSTGLALRNDFAYSAFDALYYNENWAANIRARK